MGLEWCVQKLSSIRVHLYLSLLLRMILIGYGHYQDKTLDVKFTDVDYRVFTDASRHVWQNESPYKRHTYRYTPLLAWMLIPNITLSPFFGKLLFGFFDILAGRLIFAFVKRFQLHNGDVWAMRAALIWLYNPLVFTVSCRGNAESIVVTLILTSLYLYRDRVFFLSGMCLALAIHFKLYPIIYTVPMYAALTDRQGLIGFLTDFNAARLRFVLGTVSTLALVSGAFYHLYGMDFLHHAYLYHLTRSDTRHNFSVYFYMLYLTLGEDEIGLSLVTFLPQLTLLFGLTKKFSQFEDIPFCLFCQTFVFVVYNKVCTSQYFLWYWALLPLIMPGLNMGKSEAVASLLWWALTQAFWLLPAYFLEFKGYNMFQLIWIGSLAFFSANVGLLSKCIRKYREGKLASSMMWAKHR